MKIFTTVTADFLEFAEEWLISSARHHDPRLEISVEIFQEIAGIGAFKSDIFQKHNQRKISWVCDKIEENEGRVIFICDSDVIILRPICDELMLQVEGLDIAISLETIWDEYNIGQVAIRCSRKVADFYREIGEALAEGAWDQEIFNQLIGDSGLKHAPLSPLFSNTFIWPLLTIESRRECFTFHANASIPREGQTVIERKREIVRELLGNLAIQ